MEKKSDATFQLRTMNVLTFDKIKTILEKANECRGRVYQRLGTSLTWPSYRVCVTDLDSRHEMIIFESI